jgi:hypothetical protein
MMPSNDTVNSVLGEGSLGRAAERQKEMIEKINNGLLFDKSLKKKDIKPNPKEKPTKK